MRILTFVVLAFLSTSEVYAQAALRPAGAPVRLLEDAEAQFMRPVWSPDGRFIAFTSPRYLGLWVADADGGGLRQLSAEESVGFGFEWSPGSEAILARAARYEGVRRLNAVKVYELAAEEGRLLTEYRRDMPTLPHWNANGQVYLFNEERLEVLESGLDTAGKQDVPARPAVLVNKEGRVGRVEVSTGRVEYLAPFPDATILNLVVSPDGSKAAFEVMGGNLHAMNADGTGLVDLGPGHRPQWSPDGTYVTFMVTEDDGHAFTGSDLYAVRADGTGRVRLTDTQGSLEMNPSWSPDGRWIAFDEMNEGAIYLLPLAR